MQDQPLVTVAAAKVVSSLFVASMLLLAVARPAAHGEFTANRMGLAGGLVLIFILALSLAFLDKLGRSLASAFVWTHLFVFSLDLVFPPGNRRELNETTFVLTLMVGCAVGAAVFLRKLKSLLGESPDFDTPELTWERLTSNQPLGYFLGISICAFTVPSVTPLMGGGPDAALAAGMLWLTLLFIAVIVGGCSAARNAIRKRRRSSE